MKHVLVIGLELSAGCMVLEGNTCEENYFPLIASLDSPAPVVGSEIQQALMRHHEERITLHTGGGWEILGESEFNAAHFPGNRQLENQEPWQVGGSP